MFLLYLSGKRIGRSKTLMTEPVIGGSKERTRVLASKELGSSSVSRSYFFSELHCEDIRVHDRKATIQKAATIKAPVAPRKP
mmetsp:Transcript_60011/g.113241  ORF Transcript_60011/g.113241 Transcript_60011/m.113241 type:complete len:82 (+) Transcript_60011:358-603(+)